MNSKQGLLRDIPRVDDIAGDKALENLSRPEALRAVRAVLENLREDILSGKETSLPAAGELTARALVRAGENSRPGLRRVINMTGVILHTNLGRAPLADAAVDAVKEAATGYSTLEYDTSLGERGSRQSHVASLLRELAGAEDALVVNNNAAAVALALRALCENREVIVSRGELVEVGGAFRIPEVMEQSGCLLREVGATNRTRLSDYRKALNPERTGALLKAHTSNYRIIGFTEEVSLGELVALGKESGLPVIYDLGSGSLLPLEPYGILGEPSVPWCVSEGVGVLTFSGDKLLGGPQAGIILGKKEYIARMKSHPFARAVRIDKLTLAALEATLRLYRDPERAIKEIPTLNMLTETRESLREKARKLICLCGETGGQLSIADTESQVGGGSVPARTLPSAAVAISSSGITADRLEERLRARDIPIIGRISHDALLLDLRTAMESDFPLIARALREILGEEKA